MSRPTIAARVWCGATLILAAARIVLTIADPASSDSASAPSVPGGGLPVAVLEGLILGAIAVIGAVVAARQPRNPIGWILSATAFFLGVLILSAHLFWALALGADGPNDGALFVAWVASWIWIPAVIPALTLFPLYFPTGRPPTARWRWVQWVVAGTIPTAFIGQAFASGRLQEYPVRNPVGVDGGLGTAVDVIGLASFAGMLIAIVGAAASLVVRFRRSRDEERQQIKWVATAAVIDVAIFFVPVDELAGEEVGFATLLIGLLIVAVAVAISILKYRLYDIDVVINRALVYGSLTATLAAVYVGSVLLLQLALSDVTEGSGLAVAASTLAVAALFGPARARIQRVVDRRFFRSRYDAARTIDAFAARLRDEVDLSALSADLQAVVVKTMRPAHLSLWLRTPGGGA